MEGEIFDNVKFEKAEAIARFNRFKKIANLWQVFEVVVVLVLLSWWSTNIPEVVKLAGRFLARISACVFNPHVVFLIGNVIIVSLYVLCRENDAGDCSGAGDLYDEYSETQRRIVVPGAAPVSCPPEKEEVMITADQVRQDDMKKENKLQIVVAEPPETKCEVVGKAVAEAEEQIRRFERTHSERLKREISVKPRRELRRSETEFRRRETSSFGTVEALSNEEFKLAVDAFINKHQRFFKQQKMAELGA